MVESMVVTMMDNTLTILIFFVLVVLLYIVYRLDLKDRISKIRLTGGAYSVNRRQKELLFEQTPYAVVSTDLYGKVLMCNERFHKKFGYKEEEMIGQNIDIIIPERFRKMHALGMKRYRETGEGSIINNDDGIELFGLHKNGNEFPVHLKLKSINDSGFKTIGAYIRNITKDKEKEKILMDELELLRAGEKSAEIGSWHWDLLNNEKKIVKVSDNFYEIFNVDKSRTITADLLMKLVYTKDQLNTALKINKAIEDKQDYVAEYRRMIHNGSLRLIKVIGCLIFNEENDAIAISGTIQKLKDGVDGS